MIERIIESGRTSSFEGSWPFDDTFTRDEADMGENKDGDEEGGGEREEPANDNSPIDNGPEPEPPAAA